MVWAPPGDIRAQLKGVTGWQSTTLSFSYLSKDQAVRSHPFHLSLWQPSHPQRPPWTLTLPTQWGQITITSVNGIYNTPDDSTISNSTQWRDKFCEGTEPGAHKPNKLQNVGQRLSSCQISHPLGSLEAHVVATKSDLHPVSISSQPGKEKWMLQPPDCQKGFHYRILSVRDVIWAEQKMIRSSFKEKVTNSCREELGKGKQMWDGHKEEMGCETGWKTQRTHMKNRGEHEGKNTLKTMCG